jgi:hypothetical protein
MRPDAAAKLVAAIYEFKFMIFGLTSRRFGVA